jgi:hypothetical protein
MNASSQDSEKEKRKKGHPPRFGAYQGQLQ